MHDCLAGKVIALPDLGFVATRNFNHSYLRGGRGIDAARRAHEIFALSRIIAADLVRATQMAEPEAERLAETLVRRRVAEQAGAVPHLSVGFTRKGPYRDKVVQAQLQQFDALMTTDSVPSGHS